MRLKTSLIPSLLLVATFGYAQELVKDINSSPGSLVVASSDEESCLVCGGFVYFIGNDGTHGRELWRSDGTAAGTQLVKDTDPGVGDGAHLGARMACQNNELYYSSNISYRSDGTAEGTGEVPGIFEEVIPFQDKLILRYLPRLILADANLNNQTLIKEFTYGPGEYLDISVVVANNYAFVVVNHIATVGFASLGIDLWAYDGTTITMVKQFTAPNIRLYPFPLGDKVVFMAKDDTHGEEPWVSDGTAVGTTLLYDLLPGSATPNAWIIPNSINGKLFIGMASPSATWVTDGTAAGTSKIFDGFEAHDVRAFSDKLYFNMKEADVGDKSLIIRTDLNYINQHSVAAPVASDITFLDVAGNNLLYTVDAPGLGNEIYYLDGTTDGLNLLKDINEGDGSSDAGAPAVLGGNVFFIANDGVHGYELWKSDGTTGGTSLIKDINNSTGDPGIGDLYLHNDKLYFFAGVDGNNPLYSNLWESDGTEAGTGLVNNTQFLYSVYAPVGNSVVAVSDDFKSILKTDLTTKITSTLAGPLNNAITGGYPNHARSAGDNAYFYAQKGGPSQLFRANPTTDEFNVTKNIESGWGSTDSNIWEQSAVLNDKLIFKAQVTDSENEPWVTDGTDAGTFQLNDINPTGMSFSNYFTKVGDHVVFLAFSAEGNYGVLTGAHIWTTDGTVDGTKPLKECTVLPIGLLNDKAMFLVEPIVGQTSELWTTDGTQEGTSKFADAPYQGQAIISWMTTASKLYFVTESELWVTDGTPQGLKKVAPIDLGETWPGPYVSSGEMVVFHSNGKIYASLGAQETTTVIGNATPDSEMYIIDEHVYFLMKDPTYGRELFKIALPQNQAQTITFNSIEAQNLSDVTFTINATASSNLPVTFTSSDTGTGRITIAGNVATMTAAGKVTIVAHQDGDSGFYPAAGVSQIVCINPNAPTLTVSGTTVTSSVDNNQWFLNDQPTSLTGKTIRPTESGLYKAITSIDGCQSDASNAINLTILGLYDENNTSIKIFPNPAENKITITAQPQSNIRIMDVSGREQFNQLTTNKETLVDVTSFATGLYFVVIKDQQQAHHLRFIKR